MKWLSKAEKTRAQAFLSTPSPIPSVMSLTVQSHWKQSSGNNWYKQKIPVYLEETAISVNKLQQGEQEGKLRETEA